MDMITYQEAATLLGVQYGTIKHAVYNGKLTRCSTGTRHALLIKKQVELFVKKHGISEIYLTHEEKAKWEEYKAIAENKPVLVPVQSDITETLENIKYNVSAVMNKMEQMNYIHELSKQCYREIQELLNKIEVETPKEMKDNFPLMPLAQ